MHENKTSLIVHNIVKMQRLNHPKFKVNNRLFCLLALFITEKLTHGKCTCQGPMVSVDFCFSINQNGYYLCWEINHFLRILWSDAYWNCWFLETQNSILASRDLIRVSQNSIRSSFKSRQSSFESRLSTYFCTVPYNSFIISYTDCEDL